MNQDPLPLATVDEAHASLQVISREIASELNEARVALEAFAERPDDRDALHRFAAHIHLARGALRLAEVYGGALLAEEMELVARYVDAHSGEGRADSDGLDALMRAMEQLPAYVERVATGARDVPLVLLPLLNDLRAVRGGALLSEGTLLLLNLRSDEQPRPSSPFVGDREVAELAKRLRPRFQIALLGWIRGEQTAENLHHLSEIAMQFEQAASTQPLFQLWWVVGAVLEALQAGGIEPNVSVKRLLGHVDRELKRLQDRRAALCRCAAGRSCSTTCCTTSRKARRPATRVAAVRESFGLHDMVAAADVVGDGRAEALSAPSVRLMRTVAAAIREDLTRVKDVLDIFVRKGATQVDDLQPQLEMLRKISDTLGVLGLGALRARVEGELESLKAIVERRMPPDDTALLSIAAALIAVEDSLDAQLVRLILPEAASGDVAGRADGRGVPPRAGSRAARVHRQHGADQGGGDAFPVGARGGAGTRPGAAARARHHGRAADARQAACGRSDGTSRSRAGHDRASRRAVARVRPASSGWPMRSLPSSTTWRRCRPGVPTSGRCSMLPKRVSPSSSRSLARVIPLRETKPVDEQAAAPASGDRSRLHPLRQRRPSLPCRRSGGHERRPGVPAAVRRGGARERSRLAVLYPQWEQNPQDAAGPARPASRVPHAEGQRPHGRRAADRRVLLEHRVAAEPRDQPDAAAFAGHRVHRARRGRGHAAAHRRARAAANWPASTSPRS